MPEPANEPLDSDRLDRLERKIDRVLARLAGGSHRHTRDCIHNMTPDEQIKFHGRTREWWKRMGLPEPIQITPEDWDDE